MVNRGVGGVSLGICGSFGNSGWEPEKKDVPVNDWSFVLSPPTNFLPCSLLPMHYIQYEGEWLC